MANKIDKSALLPHFTVEAKEHLQSLNQDLLGLEKLMACEQVRAISEKQEN